MNVAVLLLLSLPAHASLAPAPPLLLPKTLVARELTPPARQEFCQHNLGSCSRCGTVVDGRGGKCPACGAIWTTITVNGKTYRTGAGRSNSRGDWMEAAILFVFGIMGLAFVCGMIWLVQFLIEQQKQQARKAANQSNQAGQPPQYLYPPPRDPRCGY